MRFDQSDFDSCTPTWARPLATSTDIVSRQVEQNLAELQWYKSMSRSALSAYLNRTFRISHVRNRTLGITHVRNRTLRISHVRNRKLRISHVRYRTLRISRLTKFQIEHGARHSLRVFKTNSQSLPPAGLHITYSP